MWSRVSCDTEPLVNQALINLREDHTVRSYLFYCVRKLTLSGDVIEYTPAKSPG